ncbi:uncharacterized protein LY89DRAFT_309563 [Mollisia scopiformis]|uniref:Uncharacterized protein n=1 Tax=Mollisia scopiformis TaxID=149040 RepID=A0A194XRD0_MOLSC|nr:uncharacterized protein LY89DRAFT_309563 [Mollisia scopiformis]KUJ22748.1 hypothetical protein LY89DRAFT_309563 [Mollisia scopiformis]
MVGVFGGLYIRRKGVVRPCQEGSVGHELNFLSLRQSRKRKNLSSARFSGRRDPLYVLLETVCAVLLSTVVQVQLGLCHITESYDRITYIRYCNWIKGVDWRAKLAFRLRTLNRRDDQLSFIVLCSYPTLRTSNFAGNGELLTSKTVDVSLALQ